MWPLNQQKRVPPLPLIPTFLLPLVHHLSHSNRVSFLERRFQSLPTNFYYTTEVWFCVEGRGLLLDPQFPSSSLTVPPPSFLSAPSLLPHSSLPSLLSSLHPPSSPLLAFPPPLPLSSPPSSPPSSPSLLPPLPPPLPPPSLLLSPQNWKPR